MRQFLTACVDVGAEPVHICTVPQDIQFVTIKNIGDGIVYLGGPQVNSGSDDGVNTGFPLDPGEKHDIPAYDSDSVELWAVAEAASVVSFLVSSGG